MMKMKLLAGAVVSMSMLGTVYAATCPTISMTRSQEDEQLTFTSAYLKNKDSASSVVICRYEGKGDLGVSSGYRNGTPVKATGNGWKDDKGNILDNCKAVGGDASICSFEEAKL